jgi:tetratricopeptide (TPR) repeat protein
VLNEAINLIMSDNSSKLKFSECIKKHVETSTTKTFEELCDEILNTQISHQDKKQLLKPQTNKERLAIISSYTTEIKFPPSSAATEKCEITANNVREKGNEYFNHKKYHKALICYTQSIATAPTKCVSYSLAMAYANRSAVLNMLGLLQACVCDVQRALLHGYPDNLRYKIVLRQAHCYVQLGMREKAVTTMAKAEVMIDKADISTRQRQELKSQVTKSQTSSCDFIPAPLPPDLSYGINEEISVMSSCVALRYNESRGRHLVATRHIQPGQFMFMIVYNVK